MNENISWGKIAVLVVAMTSVGTLGFVVGRNARVESDSVSISPGERAQMTGQKALKDDVDEMSDWKTYSNTRYGFEMKYPETWTVKEHFGKSEEFGYGSNVSDSYLTLEKVGEYAYFTFGISDSVDDYLGQPRGTGAFDDQIFIGQTDVSGVLLDKYFDVYKNDDSTAEVGYFAAGSKDSDIRLNGKYAFIRATLGMNLEGQWINKKHSRESLMNDPDLREIDGILATVRFTDRVFSGQGVTAYFENGIEFQDGSQVVFSPKGKLISNDDGFGPGDTYSLIFPVKRTVVEIMTDVNSRSVVTKNPVQKNINGWVVVEWAEGGTCESRTAEVIGKSSNYEFSSLGCGHSQEEDFTSFEKVIASMKSIE